MASDREGDLRELAGRAVGDDEILDVARFNPKGLAGAAFAGAVAGGLAGDAAGGDLGRAFGSSIGVAAGAQHATTDLPVQVIVAVAPSKVYILGGIEKLKRIGKEEELTPIAEINRDRLGVEVHQRMSVRTLLLEDLDTGHRIELESPRLNLYHAKALMELLMLGEQHHDADDESS